MRMEERGTNRLIELDRRKEKREKVERFDNEKGGWWREIDTM